MTEKKIIKITADDLHDCAGFCVHCGEPRYEPVEPDARGYRCWECGAEDGVYGAEELLLMGRAILVDGDD